jgi:hypothetical protein
MLFLKMKFIFALVGLFGFASADTRVLKRQCSLEIKPKPTCSVPKPYAKPSASNGKRIIRFATFNASLNRNKEGDLKNELSSTGSAQPDVIATIIQKVNPDVLLINEFDYDSDDIGVKGFRNNYLNVDHPAYNATAVDYPYYFNAPSNTGIPSGFDYNNNGFIGGGDDAYGFGVFPGQYGMAVYSKYPIDAATARTFQNFLWKDMPCAVLPTDPATGLPWYTPGPELDSFRLSSKSHWDLPIQIGNQTVHFLVSHPTPPVFDGPEDRNGKRNHDEIRFWADYIHGKHKASYIYDDKGSKGGIRGDMFVIAGDQNADPFDGDSYNQAIEQLLNHRKINTDMTPSSYGAIEQGFLQKQANLKHCGEEKYDTADFADFGTNPGNLRADYVLPSKNLNIVSSGVFWPFSTHPDFALVGVYPFPSSDHKMVWVDIEM